jgi:hypothetical protein
MRKNELFEGIVLLVIGLVGIIEGVRLVIYKDPNTLYDPIGPGYYVAFSSLFLIVTAFSYIIIHRNAISLEKKLVTKEQRVRLFSSIGVIALYLFLIHTVGYLLSTILFLITQFWISGVKSWKVNIIISIVVTACYYLVFIKYCSMVFPRGIFDNLIGI